MSQLAPQYKWLEQQGEAPGAPGLEPRWTSSVKNLVGTAYSASSRVWYTLSHGIVNEIYYPTIDRPQVRDMEFLITDGETFFHEDKRDVERAFTYIDPNAPAARQTSKDPEGRYTLTKETISDPHAAVVLIRVRLDAEPAMLARLRVYALLAPHLDGGGEGNSARVLDVAGKRVILAWKSSTSLALACDRGFSRASCGFVGVSDGFQDLKQDFQMKWEYGSANHGNLALMGEIDLNKIMPSPNVPGGGKRVTDPVGNLPKGTAGRREFVVAIGFGETHHAALSATMGSLAHGFDSHLKRFVAQWARVQVPSELGRHSYDGGRLMRVSQNVILTHEDKTYNGAFIASASIPWGYAKGDDDLGGYHLVWTRDMVQSASALLACGRVDTALRALVYLACTQKPDGSFAQNFWVNGTPYWTGIQLDEVAFPIILAWRLWKIGGLDKFDVFSFTARAAGFLVRHAPITQQERWEEAAGYSPSTLAAVIAGLICAAELAHAHENSDLGTFLEEHADWLQAHLEDWTVTDKGVLHPDVKRHYMRVRPPACGEPYARPDCDKGWLHLNNRGPGERYDFEARQIIDAGFLELVRYGIRRADDPLIIDSLKVVDRILKVDAPQGPCWRRYNHDGYGEQKGGGPFLTWGQGRAWPLLTGERAHYELAAGHSTELYVKAMEGFASAGAMLPEQIWDYLEPLVTTAGVVQMGDPAGSAMPLVWAHAEYLKLLRSLEDGVVFDRVSTVEARYGAGPIESKVEIFKLRRQIQTIPAGKILRIIAAAPFEVRSTLNGWATVQQAVSRNLGYSGSFADLPTAPVTLGKEPEAEQSKQLSFTILWTDEKRWEGRNFDIEIVPRG
jgi:glucoamylase